MSLFSLLLLSLAVMANAQGCPSWNPQPNFDKPSPCPAGSVPKMCATTPQYEDLQKAGKMWPIKVYNASDSEVCSCHNTQAQCLPYDKSIHGWTAKNPLCHEMQPTKGGCCPPRDICYVPLRFNWILSACSGVSCGAYTHNPKTQKYKNLGTQVVLNYVAAYQYDETEGKWNMVPDSSFNTDGSRAPMDLLKPYGGLSKEEAWLSPMPGGAASWNIGYYPGGAKGLTKPGMMFVISTEQSFNFAFYMLNQVTLDRGPSLVTPQPPSIDKDNCWSSGNAGEMDFLESAWTVNASSTDQYRRLFSTQWNQVGRCFVGSHGSAGHADGGWFSDKQLTNSYMLGTAPNQTYPYIFAVVVDSVGNYIYRIPSNTSQAIWPGLERKTAACTLDTKKPSLRPPNDGPPCRDDHQYCATFNPNCQATSWGGPNAKGGKNQNCAINGEQGFCTNWFSEMTDTNQWLWPEGGQRAKVNQNPGVSPELMPWFQQMESSLINSWNPQETNKEEL